MAEETSMASSPAAGGTSPAASTTHLTSSSRTASRRASRHETSSPTSTSIRGNASGTENADSNLSALDPRRFTPTLHANLVGEILNLRREVDNKNHLILGLEEQLEGAEDEIKELGQTISSDVQETRQLRRRLVAIEGDSNKALDSLTQERDAAHETISELKRRVEAVQKKLKTREDEVDRMNALWDSDRQHWDDQRRGLDRKSHVAETRIKTLLQELESAYAQIPERRPSFQGLHGERPLSRGSAARPFSRASGARSALSHRRGGSMDSSEGPRFSLDERMPRPLLAGNSLADELDLGSEDETDPEGYNSGDGLPEERAARQARPYSSQSNHESAKARKLLGLTTPDLDESPLLADSKGVHTDVRAGILPVSQTLYRDMATQWSPPSSPILQPRSLDTIAEAESLLERDSLYSSKRDSTGESIATLTDRTGSPAPADLQDFKRVSMISQACQTIEQPPSPPATPQSQITVPWRVSQPEMNSISTQTEDSGSPTSHCFLQPETHTTVPFISVRRPSTSHSRNSSFEGPVLPPQTRNASCQTDNSSKYSSAAVQTDDILFGFHTMADSPERSHKRFSTETSSTRASLIVPRRTYRPSSGEHVSSIVKSFEFDNATKELRDINASKLGSTRLSRYQDLFADFDGAHSKSSDILEGLDLAELTDDSAASREPVKKTLTKTKQGWKSVEKTKETLAGPDDGEAMLDPSPDSPKLVLEDETGKAHPLSRVSSNGALGQVRSPPPNRPPPPIPSEPPFRPAPVAPVPERKAQGSLEKEDTKPAAMEDSSSTKAPKVVKKAKGADMRKMALISSGTAAHVTRPRSPSAPEMFSANDPPFPVPDRHSSKKLSWNEEPGSPTPGTVAFYGGGHYGRKTIKKRSVKKVRSGSSTRSPHRPGRKSMSAENMDNSPPLSPSTYGLSSVASEDPTSKHSELAKDERDLAFMGPDVPSLPGHKASRSHGSGVGSNQEGSTSSDTSVVDAIAQTMVGEWMWKYVRKRKQFGLHESAAAEFELGKSSDSSAQRHQRWVWLAPYERAVMWSAKQPTSGNALMGKSGRKLIIQSVLDVRDETPMSKGTDRDSFFGRSILILTAQRALKFTTTNRERHYVWLTALSFLSHSSVVPQGLNPVPQIPESSDPIPPPIASGPLGKRASHASLQRSRLHDSVRLAKDKRRPSLNPLTTATRSFTTPSLVPSAASAPSEQQTAHTLDGIISEDEAAEPPLVPRFTTRHSKVPTRGVPPARSFKSFASASSHANASRASIYHSGTRSETGSSVGGWATDGGTVRGSLLSSVKRSSQPRRATPSTATGEAVGPSTALADLQENNNFFEAIGNVGMEAFIDGIDKMADDLNRASGHRRGKKRDSLTVLRERSRSIDRKRATRQSKELRRRSRKRASVQDDGASEKSAATGAGRNSVPSNHTRDYDVPSLPEALSPKGLDFGDPFSGF